MALPLKVYDRRRVDGIPLRKILGRTVRQNNLCNCDDRVNNWNARLPYQGPGSLRFLFAPFSPETCALSLIIVASLYTVIAGFYGVVITDLIESLIVISAIVLVSTLAIEKISSIDIAALAYKVTGNGEWTSSSLKWRVNMPSGYTQYDDLTLLVFFYLLRNIFIGISSAGADPRYFGARSERECGMLSLLWASLMVFRWPMMIGFAALGIFLTSTFFSDHCSLLQAVQIIKLNVHDASPDHWHALVSSIIANPGSYPKEMIDGIRNVLQNDWQSKLSLLSYEGTIDPEKIVPAVILFIVPAGVRGFLVIAFIAAAFSSFSSSVNTATAYFTRDIYQRYLRKAAPTREINPNFLFVHLYHGGDKLYLRLQLPQHYSRLGMDNNGFGRRCCGPRQC